MSDGPELVIGLVGAIGTDLAYVSESLERHLKAVGYSSSEIRVSHLLHGRTLDSSAAPSIHRQFREAEG
jgi:hypothetical protein